MRIRVAVVAIALVAATLTAQPAVAATPAPALSVSGNKLVDSTTGATFVPRGVNIPGLEYSCVQGWTTLPATGEFAAIASWKINTVRLPLNESCWLGLDGEPTGNTVAGYKAHVKAWVDGATAAGLAVILDLHWNAPAGYKASGQRAMPDPRSGAFWSSVATAYSAYPSVMFELFNEPYSRSGFALTWDCWKNGGCQAPVENDATGTLSGATYTVTGMQALVTAVRNTGATQPILLGGLNYSNDLTGWLANKPTDPLNRLVAAWHNYPGQGCSTSCWNSTVTTVAASVPIVTTEFGNTSETASTVAGNSGNYLVPFMTWADAHGIGYLPWAWWDVGAAEANGNGSDVYALYTGSTFTPKAPSGTKFKAHLASLAPAEPEVPFEQTPRDFTGDGKDDLLVRDSAGSLWAYPGTGSSSLGTRVRLSTGWSTTAVVLSPGDFTGDGRADVIARDSVGGLWVYPGTGAGSLSPRIRLSTGWQGATAILSANDFTGDGHVDIIARGATGSLYVYRGTGTGGLGSARLLSAGWQNATALLAPGDVDGDGHADIVARDSAGALWFYRGTGTGTLVAGRTRLATGWSGFDAIVSAGDLDADGTGDLLARDSAGTLWLYPLSGDGGVLDRSTLGTGWATYKLSF